MTITANPLLVAPAPVAAPAPARVRTAPGALDQVRPIAGGALLCVAGLTLWSLLYLTVFSGLQHDRSQRTLYTAFRQELALETAPVGEPIPAGSPVARLDIPAAGVHEVVVEGTTSDALTKGPGHLRSTVLPGQPGVSVLFGRALAYGGPFRRVPALRQGDPITVVTQQGTFRYTVDRVRHVGDPQAPPLASGAGRLELVTADAGAGGSRWMPSHPVYVDATLQGPAAVPGPSSPTVASGSELALHRTAGSLGGVVLGLLAMLAAAAGLAWGAVRWTPAQTWVIATPVTLTVLWFAADLAARALPNLY